MAPTLRISIISSIERRIENVASSARTSARCWSESHRPMSSGEVVCVSGDGAAGFNFMEMQCAAREGLPLTVVIFAEGSWTMEEPSELATYGRTFGTEMGTVRWDKVAEGLGCHGEYVTRPEEIRPALARALASGRPSVVNVIGDARVGHARLGGNLLGSTRV